MEFVNILVALIMERTVPQANTYIVFTHLLLPVLIKHEQGALTTYGFKIEF
jgi:hypothetical protein